MDNIMKIAAIVLFVLTYVLLLALPKRRAHVAVISAAIFVIAGILPYRLILQTVNWNVLMMLAGTMGTVSLFISSKMPALLGDIIIEKTPNVKWAVIALSLFAGLISAFIDNVATVLMIAPVALTISKKLKISPVPAIIAISISSNLQGAATLVGDTTSILLGGQADLDFMDFFVLQGKPGMFWIVQISAIAAAAVLLFVLRGYNQPIKSDSREKVTDFFPTVLLVGTIALLILASFVPAANKPEMTNGFICMGVLIVGLVRELIKTREFGKLVPVFKDMDVFTLVLLAGLFIVIGGVTQVGVVEDISRIFVTIGKDNIFVIFTLIVWFSVLVSAVIDNIPYVATMLPVAAGISELLGVSPYLLYFGLLTGATLGGNLTPIGASANIAALGILRKDGYEVKAGTFMKMSVPFTLTAVVVGYILVWFIWK